MILSAAFKEKMTKLTLQIDSPHHLVNRVEGTLNIKKIVMNNGLRIKDREVIAVKHPAPVISIQTVVKEKYKQKEESSKMKVEEKMPLFYTEPIFRAKDHELF